MKGPTMLLNFSAQGGDGACIEDSCPLRLSNVVILRLPSQLAKELEHLNPATGIIMGIDRHFLSIQILPDKHPELKIPFDTITHEEDDDKKFLIAPTGKSIINQQRYTALNQRCKEIERSSVELAEILLDDPENLSFWRDYIFLKHAKMPELASATHQWLRGMDWFKHDEAFNWSHIINALVSNLYGFDLNL
jgi:hypothetical protein